VRHRLRHPGHAVRPDRLAVRHRAAAESGAQDHPGRTERRFDMNEVKTPKKPLIYYYVVVLLVLMLFNFLAMPWIAQRQIREVDYNTFNSMVQEGQVGQVEIQEQENRILFTDKEGTAIYKTAMVPD